MKIGVNAVNLFLILGWLDVCRWRTSGLTEITSLYAVYLKMEVGALSLFCAFDNFFWNYCIRISATCISLMVTRWGYVTNYKTRWDMKKTKNCPQIFYRLHRIFWAILKAKLFLARTIYIFPYSLSRQYFISFSDCFLQHFLHRMAKYLWSSSLELVYHLLHL